MRNKMVPAVMVMVTLLWLGAAATPGMSADEVPRISAQQLKDLLDNPSVKVIDVRLRPHWDQSTSKIKGATRHPANKVDVWAKTYPKDLTLVLYCQ
ncbi:MAG: rhodanese-like domain-containing protein [Thermodesulfobacteriota bacterium]